MTTNKTHNHARIASEIKKDVRELNSLLSALIYMADDETALQDPCFENINDTIDTIRADMDKLSKLFNE